MKTLSSIFICTFFSISLFPIFEPKKAILKQCSEQFGEQATQRQFLQSFAEHFSQRASSLRKDSIATEVDAWLQGQTQLFRRRQISNSTIIQSLFEQRPTFITIIDKAFSSFIK